MTDLSALREVVVNCDASAALKALPALLDELMAARTSLESAAIGLGQSRFVRIAELEEREKTLVVFANAALEHQCEAEADLAALRQQAADMERGVADALTSAMGDHDLGVVAGVELLAERYAALREQHDAAREEVAVRLLWFITDYVNDACIDFMLADRNAPAHPAEVIAAWSRYQQEKTRREP